MVPTHQAGEAREITRAVPLPHGAAFVLQEYSPGGEIRSSVVISERDKEPKIYHLPEGHVCTGLLYAQNNLYALYRRNAGKQGGGTLVVSPNGIKNYELIGAMGIYESDGAVRFKNRQSGQEFRLFPAPLVYIRKRGEYLLAASTHNAVLIKDGVPYSLNLSRINGIDVTDSGNVILLTENEEGTPLLRIGHITRLIPQAKGAKWIEFIPPDTCVVMIPSGVLLVGKKVIKKDGIVWVSHNYTDFVSSVVVISSGGDEKTHQVYYLPTDGKGVLSILEWI